MEGWPVRDEGDGLGVKPSSETEGTRCRCSSRRPSGSCCSCRPWPAPASCWKPAAAGSRSGIRTPPPGASGGSQQRLTAVREDGRQSCPRPSVAVRHDAATEGLASATMPALPELGSSLLDVVVRTAIVYTFLVVAIRRSGKREIGQMSVLELIVILIISDAVQNSMVGEK